MKTNRTLTVLAQDPSVRVRVKGKLQPLTAELKLPAEALAPGPRGRSVHVVDYDAPSRRLLAPLILPASGRDPFKGKNPGALADDPKFHAQNVYALVMATLGRFERALGRRLAWGFRQNALSTHQLKVVPHAFIDANAFYSREDEALMFGYFADERGRTVFTCLSHDIVVHEATHAMLDGLRAQFDWVSSPDQDAFHEAFADIVALLSVLAQPEFITAMLKRSPDRADMKRHRLTPAALDSLLALGEEMGHALPGMRGRALRESVRLKPDRAKLTKPNFQEAHARGEVLVAAVLRAFVHTWHLRLSKRMDELEAARLDPSFAAEIGSRIAERLLTLCIRAIDYLPPCDLAFGDFLSAVVTSDERLFPDDDAYEFRDTLRSAFDAFGITPTSREPGGVWRRADLPPRARRMTGKAKSKSTKKPKPEAPVYDYAGCHLDTLQHDPEEVFRFVWQNRETLDVYPKALCRVTSVRQCMREADDGIQVRETVAEYVETLVVNAHELPSLGLKEVQGVDRGLAIHLHGGGTLIFDEFGKLIFHVKQHLMSKRQNARVRYQADEELLGVAPTRRPGFRERHLRRASRGRVVDTERS